MISSRMFTSCTLPLVMRINVGMLPCRSSIVCILTAALCARNLAQRNRERQRSMVVESKGVEAVVQVDSQRIAGVERSGRCDQDLRKVGKDPPIMSFVRIS